ncbi:MAG TPA: CdaR family protein [Candidatus Dormibacteraeota bacterium]|nr:CdaR family protein [Candidatus Dormibacteraeota bacterium]
MSWLTDDWRLKVLALMLAVLMLGAVAFSQNPPTTRTLTVPLSYHALAQGIVIIHPPTKVNVTFSGLAEVISGITADNLTASADASQAKPGPAVTLPVTARYTGTNPVNVSNPAPIVVYVDEFRTVAVPVEVVARPAPGWTITKRVATCGTPPAPCTVNFSGPGSWENGLRAIVVFSQQVNFNSSSSPSQPISFVNSSGSVPTTPTEPQTTWDVANVNIDIEAQQASFDKTVALVAAAPAQPPPPRYQLVGVVISPATVVISGDPAVIGRIQNIVLPAIDLSSATSNTTVHVSITYPDNVTGVTQIATITFLIQPNPNVSPSP